MALGIAGGAVAAFTGLTETKGNRLSLVAGEDGAIVAEIKEPQWDANKADPLYAMNLQPGEEVVKDPYLDSYAKYEAWAFMTVEIPTLNGVTEDDKDINGDWTVDRAKAYDAIKIVEDSSNIGDGAGKWTLVFSDVSTTVGRPSKYVYGYNDKVAINGETNSLFNAIQVPNFLYSSGVGIDTEAAINISGKLVQTEGYPTLNSAVKVLGVYDDWKNDPYLSVRESIKNVEAKTGYNLLGISPPKGMYLSGASIDSEGTEYEHAEVVYYSKTTAKDDEFSFLGISMYRLGYMEDNSDWLIFEGTKEINGVTVHVLSDYENYDNEMYYFWSNGTNEFSVQLFADGYRDIIGVKDEVQRVIEYLLKASGAC